MGPDPGRFRFGPHPSLVQASQGRFSESLHHAILLTPQTSLTIDSFELLKVIGKGSFGKVRPDYHSSHKPFTHFSGDASPKTRHITYLRPQDDPKGTHCITIRSHTHFGRTHSPRQGQLSIRRSPQVFVSIHRKAVLGIGIRQRWRAFPSLAA